MIVQTQKGMQRFWECVLGLAVGAEKANNGVLGLEGKGAKVFVSTNKMKYSTSKRNTGDAKEQLDKRMV
jgi:hypothetical protein